MKFFKEETEKLLEVTFEDLQSLEFNKKRFHLSGNFSDGKENFAESITKRGGIVRGYAADRHLSIKDTDYLIVADGGVKEKGQIKSFGDKAIKVQKHNNKKEVRHIPIIREAVCILMYAITD